MKEYFCYTSVSGENHKIDILDFMKKHGYNDIVHCKRNFMGWIGLNKRFVEE